MNQMNPGFIKTGTFFLIQDLNLLYQCAEMYHFKAFQFSAPNHGLHSPYLLQADWTRSHFVSCQEVAEVL